MLCPSPQVFAYVRRAWASRIVMASLESDPEPIAAALHSHLGMPDEDLKLMPVKLLRRLDVAQVSEVENEQQWMCHH